MIDIVDYIPEGNDGARISLREIGERIGLSSRDIRRAVENARNEGIPILADGNGYWISHNPEEIARWKAKIKKYCKTLMKTAQAVRSDRT